MLHEDQAQDTLDRPVVEKTATFDTAPTAGVMLWSDIACTRGTMTSQRYVHDILLPHVLPLMQRLPVAIFQQDNA
ncbi:hypothetical protein TNCV_3822661 [Trichonephila clavipes]|nr:hypothetical protein TNCV_3822661 [Trichonephila clavipes]